MNDGGSPVLYAVVTGSPVARDVGTLVDLARADGWEVCVIASPYGRRFIDVDELAARTGYPVRSEYKQPGTPDVLPPPDALIAAPITCNSVAKWAAGISDTLPLGLLVEGVGKRLPVVAVPFSNRAQLGFPAIRAAVRDLSSWGVIMLADDEGDISHEPGQGERLRAAFPWGAAWRALLAHPWLAAPGRAETE